MTSTDQRDPLVNDGLIDLAGIEGQLALPGKSEEAWIDVIQKMDLVYADLVRYQLQLEQKNAELEETQAFINSVMSSMTDVLIVCDTQGIIQEVNAAYLKLSGATNKSLFGMALSSIFDPSSQDFIKQLTQTIRNEELIADRELLLLDKSGHPSPFAMNCSARYDHEGRFVGVVLIGRHLGELRRAYKDLNSAHQKLRSTQQQLVFAEKMTALGRLVAGVAHELNNPISFVFGNMHALRRYGDRITKYFAALDQGLDKEKLLELRRELNIDRIVSDIGPLVDGTLEGAERVSEIVQELRRFSSVQKEATESFDAGRVVRTAAQWVSKSAASKPQIIYDMPENLEIVSRRGPVHQIIVNLIQNAVDVIEQQRKQLIRISCAKVGKNIEISVQDNGPGIQKDVLDRIFEPFFTTKLLGHGTGLGLYISYGLAEELGGEISARNLPKGGAEFILYLPVKED